MNTLVLEIIGVTVFFFAITCVALFDAARREFAEPYQKVLWMGVALVPFLGFAAWFLWGRRYAVPRVDRKAGGV